MPYTSFSSHREAQNAITKATAAYEKAKERSANIEYNLTMDPGTFLTPEQAAQANELAAAIENFPEFSAERRSAEDAYYNYVDAIRNTFIDAARAEETAALNEVNHLFHSAQEAGLQVHCRYK